MRRMSWRNVASSKWRFKSGKRGGVAPSSGCGIAGFWMSNLDSILHQVENMDMRRAHKLALILGVLLGLVGQTVTVAASPAVETAISETALATMPMDCVGMMQGDDEKSIPCQQMTVACLAGMGCLPLFALDSRSSSVAEMVSTDLLLILPSYPALYGRSAQPEQHPPNPLA